MGDDWTLATVLNTHGDVARSQGDYPRAKRLYDESLTLFGILHNDGQRPSILHNLGYAALHERDFARSSELFRESLRLFQRFGERRGVTECLVSLPVSPPPLAGQTARRGCLVRPKPPSRLWGPNSQRRIVPTTRGTWRSHARA